jgi:hypothetical protein
VVVTTSIGRQANPRDLSYSACVSSTARGMLERERELDTMARLIRGGAVALAVTGDVRESDQLEACVVVCTYRIPLPA